MRASAMGRRLSNGNKNAIKSWKSAGKGRVVVVLSPRTADDVFTSQENAAAFRAFIDR